MVTTKITSCLLKTPVITTSRPSTIKDWHDLLVAQNKLTLSLVDIAVQHASGNGTCHSNTCSSVTPTVVLPSSCLMGGFAIIAS